MTIISILVKKIGKSQDFVQNGQTNPLPQPSSPKNTKKVVFVCILHLGLLKAMFFSFKKTSIEFYPRILANWRNKITTFSGVPLEGSPNWQGNAIKILLISQLLLVLCCWRTILAEQCLYLISRHPGPIRSLAYIQQSRTISSRVVLGCFRMEGV